MDYENNPKCIKDLQSLCDSLNDLLNPFIIIDFNSKIDPKLIGNSVSELEKYITSGENKSFKQYVFIVIKL